MSLFSSLKSQFQTLVDGSYFSLFEIICQLGDECPVVDLYTVKSGYSTKNKFFRPSQPPERGLVFGDLIPL